MRGVEVARIHSLTKCVAVVPVEGSERGHFEFSWSLHGFAICEARRKEMPPRANGAAERLIPQYNSAILPPSV